MLSVFMLQENVKQEADGKKRLREAKRKEEDCIGGRVLQSSGRNRKATWMVQLFYVDKGGRPPRGMARLTIPSGSASDYGIKGL
jgi:hypothetical protein